MVRSGVMVIVALASVWLALLVTLAIVRPDTALLRESVRLVPDVVRLLRRLAGDPAIGRGVRFRLWLVLAYLAIPIDLVPDFIPVLGYADDATIVSLVLRSVIRHAGPDRIRQHWPGTDAGLTTLAALCRVRLDPSDDIDEEPS